MWSAPHPITGAFEVVLQQVTDRIFCHLEAGRVRPDGKWQEGDLSYAAPHFLSSSRGPISPCSCMECGDFIPAQKEEGAELFRVASYSIRQAMRQREPIVAMASLPAAKWLSADMSSAGSSNSVLTRYLGIFRLR